MNKTLALIAALGLVVSAPAFAADEGTAPVVKTDSATTSTDTKETKGTKSKDKVASKSTTTTTTASKTAPKAVTPSDELAPAAGGAEKSDKQ